MTLTNFLSQVVLFAAFCVIVKGGSFDKYLEFENCSKSLVKGCYFHNGSLSLCFEIQPDLIQLTDKNNNLLVRYRKMAPQRFHVQVLGDHFLWTHPTAEPLLISTANRKADSWTEADADFMGGIKQSHPALYQRAMMKLRRKQEIQLLDRVSLALHNAARHYPITKTFHVMTMSLMAGHGLNTPAPARETADNKSHRYLRLFNKNRDSCVDLSGDPNGNHCLGMCGPSCWCWKVVCDDCCFHTGCYEHDKCCQKSRLSSYCALPFFHTFHCHSYGGYPACL